MRAYLFLARIAIAIMLTVSALHMALGIGTAKLLDPGRRAEGGPAMTTPTPKSA